jgi:translation initiation factor 1 (eIF-1/SUI1)
MNKEKKGIRFLSTTGPARDARQEKPAGVKWFTLVTGFKGKEEDLETLAKRLNRNAAWAELLKKEKF